MLSLRPSFFISLSLSSMTLVHCEFHSQQILTLRWKDDPPKAYFGLDSSPVGTGRTECLSARAIDSH